MGVDNGKNMHGNHRARMREKLFSSGVEAFHDHELLEMLLYSCESRRNTNETAHELINRFGSLQGVFRASPEALKAVPGVKDAATALVIVSREIMRRIEEGEAERPDSFENRVQFCEYILRLYKFSVVEELYMHMFDNGNRFIDSVLINRGNTNTVCMDIRKMVEEILKRDAASIIISHNHPGGKLISSSEDMLLTRDLAFTMNKLGIELIDHILVANNKYTSIMCYG